MQRFPTRLALTALAALALVTSRPAAADRYTVTDLGALPGYSNSSVWQQTINNNGVVAAYAFIGDDPNTGLGDESYLWRNGAITPLPGLPNAINTTAFSLNDRGQVVGRSKPSTPPTQSRAVMWDKGVIQALGELPGDNASNALNINNRGQAVGWSGMRGGGFNTRHAALWYKGRLFQLPSLPGGGMADIALGINEEGQIVGHSGPAFGLEHPVLWDKGAMTDLGTLGGDWGEAIAINNRGQIVGLSATVFGEPHAFLWKNGVLTDLGVLGNDVFGVALDINNRGQVVGNSGADPDDIATNHALLWENGAIIDLQTKIPAASGWTLVQALGINDRGQIVGQGILNGKLRAFLLTPVSHGHDDDDDDD